MFSPLLPLVGALALQIVRADVVNPADSIAPTDPTAKIPTFHLQCARAHGCCQNFCYAFHHGIHPDVLTRRDGRAGDPGCQAGAKLVDGKLKKGYSPCTPGNSIHALAGTDCDEYPYASTYEAHKREKSAMLRCIPSGENRSGGVQLKNFYRRQNVKDGDKFRVAVSYDKENAPSFCHIPPPPNDGTEFHLPVRRGNLTIHRTTRDATKPDEDSSEESTEWTDQTDKKPVPVPNYPIFETSTGQHTIWPHTTARVGEKFWIEDPKEEGKEIEVTLTRLHGFTDGTVLPTTSEERKRFEAWQQELVKQNEEAEAAEKARRTAEIAANAQKEAERNKHWEEQKEKARKVGLDLDEIVKALQNTPITVKVPTNT